MLLIQKLKVHTKKIIDKIFEKFIKIYDSPAPIHENFWIGPEIEIFKTAKFMNKLKLIK